MNNSHLIEDLNSRLLSELTGKPYRAAEAMIRSPFVKAFQDMANIVSKQRLKINDHGEVHMRKVAVYSLEITQLLRKSGIRLSGEEEGWAEYEDCLLAILVSAFLHDIGMAIHRQRHEFFTLVLVNEYVDKLLNELYDEEEILLKVGLKSLITEAIAGHMGTQKVASLEAGILLVADGCDLEYGRARKGSIQLIDGRVGDIHQYSASAIDKVEITEGKTKPVRISVHMEESAGFFQVEEILMSKLSCSPIKEFVEMYAFFNDKGITKKYS